MEVRISYNLIIEGVPLWLGDILLVKRKLLDPAHPQREEITQGPKNLELGIVEGHLSDSPPQHAVGTWDIFIE